MQRKKKAGAPEGNQNALGNRGGPGAPTKYDDTFPERAFKLALLGLTDEEMAPILGISESTLNAWKNQHIEFAGAIVRGKTPADSEVAHGLYAKAKEGDVQAARYWLNNRQRSKWADRIEHTGAEGGSIAFIIEGAPTQGTKS